jgi:hypothetical protein
VLVSGAIDPEEDRCDEADGGEKSVDASIMAHSDAAALLYAAEHILDTTALAVEYPIIGDQDLPAAC